MRSGTAKQVCKFVLDLKAKCEGGSENKKVLLLKSEGQLQLSLFYASVLADCMLFGPCHSTNPVVVSVERKLD